MVRLKNAQGAEITLPPTIYMPKVPFDIRMSTQALAGADGVIITGKSTLGAPNFALQGRLYYPGDKAKIRQEADRLLAFLMHAPIEVYPPWADGRCLIAHPQGMPQHWIDKGVELDLQIPMLAPDPYWYGDKEELVLSGAQYIEIEGNAPVIPFIETTSTVPSLMVISGDYEISITGASGKIEIDSVNFEVKVDGENRVDLANDSWKAFGFALFPGENLISSNVEIKLSFRPRWF